MRWGAEHGVLLGPEPKFPSAAEIWKRHSVETTAIYLGVFTALALMDFTILWRLVFAALAGLLFGSIWIENSPSDQGLPGSSVVMKRMSNFGYWCLAVFDWFAYMSVLCFAAAVVVDLL